MRRRFIAALTAGVLALFGAACDDTVGGIEEDVQEGADEVEQEVDEELDAS